MKMFRFFNLFWVSNWKMCCFLIIGKLFYLNVILTIQLPQRIYRYSPSVMLL